MSTEHLTESQHLEQRITQALVTIRRDHPHVLPTRPKGAAMGTRGQASLIKHADDSDRSDDLDGLTRRIDASHHVTVMVNSWVRMVAEDFDVTATLPNGFDVPDMCAFLERWSQRCSWHPAGEDMAAELETLVQTIREFVPALCEDVDSYRPDPIRRLIGRCTEEVEGDDETGHLCAGRVFAYPDGDGAGDHDSDDPWATCERCGSRAVVSVWQRWMFPEVAQEVDAAKMRDRVVSAAEVLTLAHREFGRPMTHRALSHWVTRGLLAPIDPGEAWTFRLGDVVDALAKKVG